MVSTKPDFFLQENITFQKILIHDNSSSLLQKLCAAKLKILFIHKTKLEEKQ